MLILQSMKIYFHKNTLEIMQIKDQNHHHNQIVLSWEENKQRLEVREECVNKLVYGFESQSNLRNLKMRLSDVKMQIEQEVYNN